jgi:hypothetical protein
MEEDGGGVDLDVFLLEDKTRAHGEEEDPPSPLVYFERLRLRDRCLWLSYNKIVFCRGQYGPFVVFSFFCPITKHLLSFHFLSPSIDTPQHHSTL